MKQEFKFVDFGWRFLFALLLVCLTFNSTGYSISHWLVAIFPKINPGFLVCALILAIGWGIYLRATLRSLGKVGLGLILLLIAALIWFFVDLGWLSLANFTLFSWVSNFAISIILAVGMSWSHVRRKLTGQMDVDDVDR